MTTMVVFRVRWADLVLQELRRLAHDLGFPLDAGPADLDAAQWAGLFALLDRGRPGKTG
jgi:hypothetical protein